MKEKNEVMSKIKEIERKHAVERSRGRQKKKKNEYRGSVKVM